MGTYCRTRADAICSPWIRPTPAPESRAKAGTGGGDHLTGAEVHDRLEVDDEPAPARPSPVLGGRISNSGLRDGRGHRVQLLVSHAEETSAVPRETTRGRTSEI